MADILFELILPMGLAGTLFYAVLCLLRPLAGKMKPGHPRAALLLAAALLVVPLHLPVLLEAPAPAAEAPSLAQAGGLGNTLRTAAPTAPVYQAGQAVAQVLEPPQAGTAAAPGAGWSFGQTASFVYLAGVGLFLAVAGARYLWLLRPLVKSCSPVADNDPARACWQALCIELGVEKPPLLCRSPRVSGPVLAGVLRPRVILPEREMDHAELRFALTHELTHYRQHDLPLKLALLLPAALHWYNPVCLLLRRDFANACELACDARVAQPLNSAGKLAYADTLLHFAGAEAAGGMASCFSTPATRLKKRLAALVKPGRPGKGLKAGMALLVGSCLALVLLAGCSFAAGAAGQNGSAPEPDEPFSIAPDPSSGLSRPVSSQPEDGADSSLPENPADSALSGEDGDYSLALGPAGDTILEASGDYVAMICPVPGALWSSRGFVDGHRGVDLNAEVGTPVYAAQGGEVVEAGNHYSYGNYLTIRHPSGLTTLYAHCDSLKVEKGQAVEQGEQVATVGSTGQTTGAALHFEVIENGEVVDPLGYIALPEGIGDAP